jgi:predicted TPR repeat methyltransferase
LSAIPFPSPDPRADRRAEYAEALAGDGDIEAAIEVLSGAMDLVPQWAAGWFRLGEFLERAGKIEAAGHAWERAIASDPSYRLGAGRKRDLLRATGLRESMPAAFVETLFDQYAGKFDASLVGKLNYRGPQKLLHALQLNGFMQTGRALDLGCGTGLMGEALRPHCDWLGGYDISAGMLAQAQRKGVYDLLEKRDISQLQLGEDRFDLIVAADVFIYLGALERIVGWCAGSLNSGGLLAFTVEASVKPVELRESRRFAHSHGYVEGLLHDAGFAGSNVIPCVLRQDRGQDVAGLCVVASPAPFRRDREPDGEAHALA